MSKYVHPKDLKKGDIVMFSKNKSWIRSECDTDHRITTFEIGKLYEVYRIEKTGNNHISGKDGIENPLVRVYSKCNNACRGSAYWGSWELVNRKIEPEVFGIVKFMRIINDRKC